VLKDQKSCHEAAEEWPDLREGMLSLVPETSCCDREDAPHSGLACASSCFCRLLPLFVDPFGYVVV
jgi:hypothetical protein